MRIGITADPEIPVPPNQYGGIERIVDLLVRGLIAEGHEVTLFANRESSTPCPVVAWPEQNGSGLSSIAANAWCLATEARSRHLELIHSFGRLGYLGLVLPLRIPKIMSYQRAITRSSVLWGTRLSLGTLRFTACSRQMTNEVAKIGKWQVVYNSVSPAQYEFRPTADPDAPLAFLGRVEHIKGPHLAIEVARRTGRHLVIAGNIPNEPMHQKYFDELIRPHLDGEQIVYAGPVNDEQKNELLGRSAALLMPILWDEPFGIVMAEALACGTPVIAMDRGAAPEVVDHGVNGFLCKNADEMVSAVDGLRAIDRTHCRRSMEERFSSDVMVADYLSLYKAVLN